LVSCWHALSTVVCQRASHRIHAFNCCLYDVLYAKPQWIHQPRFVRVLVQQTCLSTKIKILFVDSIFYIGALNGYISANDPSYMQLIPSVIYSLSINILNKVSCYHTKVMTACWHINQLFFTDLSPHCPCIERLGKLWNGWGVREPLAYQIDLFWVVWLFLAPCISCFHSGQCPSDLITTHVWEWFWFYYYYHHSEACSALVSS
jgi:hypothetical protein